MRGVGPDPRDRDHGSEKTIELGSPGVGPDAAAGALRALPLALATGAQNLLGLAFTILFARWLGPSGYGSLAVLVSAFIVLSVPGSALQVEVARRLGGSVARASGENERRAAVAPAWRWLRGLACVLALATVLGLIARDALAALLAVDEPWAAALLPATACAWALLCVARGVCQALGLYGTVAVSIVADSTLRIALAAPLVAGGLGVVGAFGASTLAFTAVAGALAIVLSRQAASPGHDDPGSGLTERDRKELRLRDLLVATRAPLAALTLLLGMQELHVIVAKHVAATTVAAAYAATAVAAKSIIWVAMGLSMYVVPESARRTAREHDPRRALAAGLGLLALPALMMTAIFLTSGHALLALAFGSRLATASNALVPLGLAMSMLALTYVVGQYLLALKRPRFVWLLLAGLAAEVAAAAPLAAHPAHLALALFVVFAIVAIVISALAIASAPNRQRGLFRTAGTVSSED